MDIKDAITFLNLIHILLVTEFHAKVLYSIDFFYLSILFISTRLIHEVACGFGQM